MPTASVTPMLRLGTYPTPIEPLVALSTGRSTLWIKRDDLTSPRYGGNKVRKLERILAQAKASGADRLVTVGAAGSHHVVATAVHGRLQGFQVEAVLIPHPTSQHVVENVRAALGQGVRVFPVSSRVGVAPKVALRMLIPGAFLIPPGGSSLVGALGYVDAATELADQIRAGRLPEPDVLVVAMGSGGTAAGLAAGLALRRLRTRVLGVAVTPPVPLLTGYARSLARRCLHATSAPTGGVSERLRVDASYLGEGYGRPTEAATRAAARAASEGVELDATYTAKAFAAALDFVAAGSARNVLYWHTLSSAPMTPLLEHAPAGDELPPAVRRLLR